MNLIFYAIIAIFSFVFLGTLVPSLVSAADTTLVFTGFGLGAVFFCLMLWSVYHIGREVLAMDDED